MSEIQIGLSKSARPTYSLDDVALVPTRRTRDRRDVDTSWQIDAFKFDTPIIGAPMDSVMSPPPQPPACSRFTPSRSSRS